MTDKRIRVRVDSGNSKQEIRDLNNEMRGLGRSADSAGDTFGRLKTTVVAVAAALSAGVITRYADAWTRLNNQIKQTTQTTTQALAVQEAIFQIAKDSRVEIEGVAEAYQRISNSVAEFGFSAEDSLDVVEGLTKAFKANGASAQEAASVLVQLGQGLGSGALQGEELRAVLEASLPVSRAIAKEFGVTVGQLKELGSQGELTTERVFNAIRDSLPEFESAFAKANVTIAEGIQVADNSLTRLIGEINTATGASSTFANGLLELSNAIDFLGDAVASGAASEIAGIFQDQLSLIGRDVDLTAEFIANVWSDLGGQIAAETVSSTVDIGDAFLNIIPNIRTLVQVITVEIASAVDKLGAYASAVEDTLNPFDDVSVDQARGFFDDRIASINEVRESSLQSIFDQREAEQRAQKARIDESKALIEQYQEQRKARELSLSNISSGVAPAGGSGAPSGGGTSGGDENQEQTTDISQQIEQERLKTQKLREEIELRKALRNEEITQQQFEQEQGLIDIFYQYEQRRIAILDNERLTAEQRQQLLNELALQEIEAERLKQEQLTSASNQGVDERLSYMEQGSSLMIQSQSDLQQATLGLISSFSSKSKKAALALLAIQKGLAIANTITGALAGSVKVYGELPYPAAVVASGQILAQGKLTAGLIAAQGIAQAASITSSGGGGGGASTVSSSTAASQSTLPSANTETTQQQQRIIDIRGLGDNDTVTLNKEELTELLTNDDDVILSVNQGQANGQRLGVING